MSKHDASRTIIKAVRTVLEGKLYLSQPMTEPMVQRAVGAGSNPHISPIERLTDREIEIFEMIGHGLTIRQIAQRLPLTPRQWRRTESISRRSSD